MNHCEHCQHWHPHRAGVRAVDSAIGECRAGPPAQNYFWPRTKATDGCSTWRARAAFAQAAAPAPTPETDELRLTLTAATQALRRTSRKPATP